MIAENQTFLAFWEVNATKFGSKNWILHTIIYHYVTSYLYIIMIIVDSCMVWFHFDCIMQLWKNHVILLLMFVAEKVLLRLVTSLTDDKGIPAIYNQLGALNPYT